MRKKIRLFKNCRIPAFALIFCLSLQGCALAALPPVAPKDMKPGFLYIGPALDGGWSHMHEIAREKMIAEFPDLATFVAESVAEGPDSENEMEKMIKNGSKLIFATSFGYMDHVLKVAKRHPNIAFMHCAGYKTAENVGTYFGRIYQPRYLSGLVAGAATQSNLVGYVAAFPIPEVIRGLNAFTLGVRRVNPNARVKVVWLFSWHDPAKEREATKALYDMRADVIGMHADTGAAPQAAEALGIHVVGYNDDMKNHAPTKHLTAPIWNWDMVYRYVIDNMQRGTWKPEEIWWGLREGLVGLSPYGDDVTDDTKNLVELERERIVSGAWDVFHGPIKDTRGNLVVPEGASLTDRELLNMTWYVEGIEGEISK